MQIRGVGRRWQLWRYDGYDRTKGRGRQVMVGSFAQSVKEIPPELLDALSEVEKEQLTNFLWHRWRRQNVQVLEQRLAKLPVYLRQMAEAVNDGYEVPAPEEIWVALNALS